LNKYIYILFLYLYLPISIQAQSDDYHYREMDASTWAETVDGQQYQEKRDVSEESEWEPEQTPVVETNWMNLLAYVALIIILAALIVLLLRMRLRGAGIKARTVAGGDMMDLDERPMESDLERLLREAIHQQDWRLAFRIQYLMIIKALHDGGRIRWKKEKTNHDYVREVANSSFFPGFREQSLRFDRIWYGLQPMQEADYRKQQDSIQTLIQEIRQQ
jgi:hypothetical protein